MKLRKDDRVLDVTSEQVVRSLKAQGWKEDKPKKKAEPKQESKGEQ